jgi:hypothetical protein
MPLDVVSPSLSKPRREEALIRSTMALLSKVFSGKKFHLVKLNVGATNFIEDASKGTSSLLRSWVGKGGGRSGLLTEKEAECDGNLAENHAERKGNVAERGAQGNGSPLEPTAEISGSLLQVGSAGIGILGTVEAAPKSGLEDDSGRCSLGAMSESKERIEGGQDGRKPPKQSDFGSHAAEKSEKERATSEPSSVHGDHRKGSMSLGSPHAGKGLSELGAVAGSVLHANLGSKRDARAVREALEGVKPVLGNGHTQAQGPWQRSVNLSGLGDHSNLGDDLDQVGLEWGAEEDGFAGEGGGFRGDFGGESEGEEDLWNDLQSVQWERQSFPAPRSSRKVEESESHGASDKPQMIMDSRSIPSGELSTGENTQRRGIGLQALWVRASSGPQLREEGADMLNSVARGECGNGSLGLAEVNRRRSSDVDENLANGRAIGEDVSDERQCKPNISEVGLAGANLLNKEFPLAAIRTKRSVEYSLTDKEVGSHIEKSVGVSRIEANSKDGGLALKSFPEKCSTCGEVLFVDPLTRQEHIDFHVAVKLQKQEEKIGRLFKAASGRTGAKKASSSSQARTSGSSCVSKKSTKTLDAFYKRS